MKLFISIYKIFEERFTRNKANFSPKYRPEIEGLKLHIGSGPINLEGWVNIDARAANHIHLNTNSVMLEEFSDHSIAEIYMCHVLEHFNISEIESILKRYKQKLKIGGILRISVPDFDLLIKIYEQTNKSIKLITPSILGGQDYEYNFHKIIFNRELLASILEKVGFKNIEEWETMEVFGMTINDWSSKEIRNNLDHYKVSLNLCCKNI
ncbi:class I SAM-dependent methyltransferase [Leptospira jelokensis]|uniref:class I SAM-dependent methyltransferase n=1 Tax=Leptospira jelokensis TaxID=2484931 RepID=UPI0010912236|nr:hypothetical protein [Leptospira jelokensis]TGL99216.1 hypothetical protein EHQ79_15490 [Leptospira jelokensis]